jgi:homoserine dehydrogenase
MTVKIGIAGLGTVGAGVAMILKHKAALLEKRAGRKIGLHAVSARDKKKDRGVDLSKITWSANVIDIAKNPDVDVVVELIGGADGAAYELVKTALTNSKHVVTANKALIAKHGLELAQLAEKKKVSLKCEAAVAGGIPILKTIREGLAANQFTRVAGILNGTCNYILTVMEKEQRDFDSALKEAQELGYAEADPSFDIDGVDAAHKLAILAAMAFSTRVEMKSLHIEGIRHITATDIEYAAALDMRVKLLGIAQLAEGGLELRVHPALVPLTSPISRVDGVLNAVEMQCDALGGLFMEGPGAGRGATASAVVADIVDIAAGRGGTLYNVAAATLQKLPISPMKNHKGAYYIRLSVLDRPGVLAGISAAFRDDNISIASLIQKNREPNKPVEIVLTTHEVKETAMMAALKDISKMKQVIETPRFIRIETL